MVKELNREFIAGPVKVFVYETRDALGREAAHEAATILQAAIAKQGRARVLFSAANSQLEMVKHLAAIPGIDWECVEAFHLDEYVGLPISHPASFAAWVKRYVVDRVHPGTVHYLAGDAQDTSAECRRYAELLTQAPVDISFLGIGENGHIGFNDPHEADFKDPHTVRVVSLDERCRLQQVHEGHWSDFSSVPTHGMTITCPALVNAAHIISCVPGPQKAEAVRNALEGPISNACPASLMRTHRNVKLYLDRDSAVLLAR